MPQWQIPTSFRRLYLDQFKAEVEQILIFAEDWEEMGYGGQFGLQECCSILNDRTSLIQGEQQGA